MCYPHFREGDIVVIIYGAKLPITLREDEQVPGQYKVMGEAYVHGYMYGEAMGKFEERDFTLS